MPKHVTWGLMGVAVIFLLGIALYMGGPEKTVATIQETILTPLVTEATSTEPTRAPRTPKTPVAREYIEVIEGCGPYFEGPCVNVRSGEGTEYPSVQKLRMGAVVEVGGAVFAEGRTWYRITYDNEWLRYPERTGRSLYIASDYVRHFVDDSAIEIPVGSKPEGTKKIVVDRSDQMLYAYDGDTLFMSEKISTGLGSTPTPRGVFTIYKKTPTRYMQGPLPGISDQYYDLPGVPWNLYFSAQGAVVHGAYWHDKFGQPWSHGCVNAFPETARKIYEWADIGTEVVVRD